MVSRERWKEGAIVPFAVAVQVGGGSVQVSGTLANNLSQRISNSTLPVPRVSGCLDQRPNLCGECNCRERNWNPANSLTLLWWKLKLTTEHQHG
jgi:hypothetical protein